MENPKSSRRKQSSLILLLLLFLVPFFIAWFIYNGHHVLFGRLLNHGKLIEPPPSIALLKLKNEKGELLNNHLTKKKPPARLRTNGKWTLLYFNPGLCGKDCQKGLYQLRQVRTATGKKRNRVAPALLTYPSNETNDTTTNRIISEKFPGTRHLTINKNQFARFIKTHIKAAYALKSGATYLIDPLGNMVLIYKPNTNPNNIFKDLQRLLKVSQIG